MVDCKRNQVNRIETEKGQTKTPNPLINMVATPRFELGTPTL